MSEAKRNEDDSTAGSDLTSPVEAKAQFVTNANAEGDDLAPPATFWAQLRRLLVFQAKLYIDAFRDLLLSPLSALAFLLDVVQRNTPEESNFSKVLRWGRRTERAINLFEHQQQDAPSGRTVDDLIREAESKLRR